MSRVGLDLSKFRKIKEDHKSATLQHPEGHKITIAKNVISKQMQEQLSKLPMHLAEGTDLPVSSNEDLAAEAKMLNGPKNLASNRPDEAAKSVAGVVPEFPEAKPVQMAQAGQPTIVINNTPPPSQQPQQSMAQPVPPPPVQTAQADNYNPVMPQMNQMPNQYSVQNDPYGSAAYANISKEGLKNQVEGINETASAQNQQNQAMAQERNVGANAQQAQLDDVTSRNQALRSEYDSFIKDTKAQHIDPNHYLSSMGVGQKIATAIGLILGGAAGGVLHQENPVSRFLDDQIKRDVEAQQSEMDKNKNLLAANYQQFGNMRDAAQMTEMMQRGIIANRIEEAGLKTGNPLLIARAKQAAGQLELQNNKLFSEMAVRQSLDNGKSNQATGPQADPATKIRMLGMVGVMTPGQVENAHKELKEAEDMGRSRENLLSGFDKVNQINSLKNRVMNPLQTPKQRDAIINPLLAQLSKDTAGRFTEADSTFIRSLFPALGDDENTIQIKRQQLEQIISQKMNFPTLKAYGINPSGSDIYKKDGQSRVTELPAVLPK